MHYIWRVQNHTNWGPYSQGHIDGDLAEMLDKHNTDNGHPTPYKDKGIDRGMEVDEICGFKDMAQVKAWFTKDELLSLYAAGFKLIRLRVWAITAIGEKQVLAIPREE